MRSFRAHPALLPMLLLGAFGASVARAATASAPVEALVPLLGALAAILLAARLGGALAQRFGLAPVLGELAAGMAIAALARAGVHVADGPAVAAVLPTLAEIGVLLLLFSVGLESNVPALLAVGRSAALVAVLGVVAPVVLGYAVSAGFRPHAPVIAHVFVGATLAATSVGLTARVLRDLGRAASLEGRIILGAAVIDDVLGLLVLAVVTGVIEAANAGRAFSPAGFAVVLAKALGFLLGALVLGRGLSKTIFALASRLRGDGVLLGVALAFCFVLSWLAGLAGLAPIVGAFAAGLVLEEAHTHELLEREPHAGSLEALFGPLSQFFVPIFFVEMGMRVDLGALGQPAVLGFAAALTLAAIAGKQACSLGVLERGVDRLAVGLGMIPRGEVGLIFAGIGATLRLGGARVIDDPTFAAVVLMVIATTVVTPPLLVARLGAPGRGR